MPKLKDLPEHEQTAAIEKISYWECIPAESEEEREAILERDQNAPLQVHHLRIQELDEPLALPNCIPMMDWGLSALYGTTSALGQGASRVSSGLTYAFESAKNNLPTWPTSHSSYLSLDTLTTAWNKKQKPE